MEGQKLERSIGLGGATATLVGYVVGASIFILPGELAASTGPAIFLSFLLASIPALLSCFVTAQIGCVYPVSGGPYIAASRNLSPFAGIIAFGALYYALRKRALSSKGLRIEDVLRKDQMLASAGE